MFGAEEDPFSVLTERELDVLHELAQGLSNKQIASVLNISEQTVKVHIRNLLRKLNVRSRGGHHSVPANAGHNKKYSMAHHLSGGLFLFTLLRRQMLHRLRDTTFNHRTASIVGR